MIPLKYNVRNLRVRWVTSLLTVVVTGVVVVASSVMFGLVEGLQHSLKVSGDPLDILVMRKGSTNETSGGFAIEKAERLLTLDGIARDADGPLAAMELVSIPLVQRADGKRTNIIIRGVGPASRKLRPGFQIVRGRDLVPGKAECIVSLALAKKFKGTGLNEELVVSRDKNEVYRVVGHFTAGGTAAESEVWADRKDLEAKSAYGGFASSVQLRAASPEARDRLLKQINEDPQFRLLAQTEAAYYADQALTATILTVLGTIVAVLLTIGAMFAAANTMFAAVKSRTREIGTMRALGFSRRDVLLSFLGESVLLCLLGGLAGGLVLPLMSQVTFGLQDFSSFAERTIQLRFGSMVFGIALAMTLAMGVFGGLFPAIRAVRLDVVKALREV